MMVLGFNHGLGDTGVPLVDNALSAVTGSVTAGAEAATPQIQAAVQPYVVTSLLLGLLTFAFGLAAFIGVRSMKKAA